MRKLLKVVFWLGVLFWGSFLAYGLLKMTAYNGFGNYFSFTCENAKTFTIVKEQNDNLKITYNYEVSGKIYTVDERISGEIFREKVGSVPVLPVCYNNTYPSLSYIQGLNLSVSREKTGVIVSIILLTFITVIYLYAKIDYWIKKYKEFFQKLSSSKETV